MGRVGGRLQQNQGRHCRRLPRYFHDFNARLWKPGGFHRPIDARKRKWKTKTGKANFIVPTSLSTDHANVRRTSATWCSSSLCVATVSSILPCTTMTIIPRHLGSRQIVLMHRNDIDRFGLREGQPVALTTAVDDGVERRVQGAAGRRLRYPGRLHRRLLPECNPLLPLWHYAEKSKTPAAKSIPVRVKSEL